MAKTEGYRGWRNRATYKFFDLLDLEELEVDFMQDLLDHQIPYDRALDEMADHLIEMADDTRVEVQDAVECCGSLAFVFVKFLSEDELDIDYGALARAVIGPRSEYEERLDEDLVASSNRKPASKTKKTTARKPAAKGRTSNRSKGARR